MSVKSKRKIQEECESVQFNLPYIQILIKSDKISSKEKMNVLESVNIDLIEYLKSIGEIT